VAFRLSTVGRGVSEGNDVGASEGAGVSVKGSVGVACGDGVTEAVPVGAPGVDDAVGGFGEPVGVEGAVRLQAHKVNIHRLEKTRFLRIEIHIPFQDHSYE
jgi:hypothetical protein